MRIARNKKANASRDGALQLADANWDIIDDGGLRKGNGVRDGVRALRSAERRYGAEQYAFARADANLRSTWKSAGTDLDPDRFTCSGRPHKPQFDYALPGFALCHCAACASSGIHQCNDDRREVLPPLVHDVNALPPQWKAPRPLLP